VFLGLAQRRPKSANAEAGEDLVHDPRVLSDAARGPSLLAARAQPTGGAGHWNNETTVGSSRRGSPLRAAATSFVGWNCARFAQCFSGLKAARQGGRSRSTGRSGPPGMPLR
jgi:hypothetical protein